MTSDTDWTPIDNSADVKGLVLQGQATKYAMKKILRTQNMPKQRKQYPLVEFKELSYVEENTLLNTLYLNGAIIETEPMAEFIQKELRRKVQSYRQQDIKKSRLDEKTFISYDELIEKLVASKLMCFYCKERMKIIYQEQRERKQWTLDRIDNDIQHTCSNTVIACMQCNMEKRRRSHSAFQFTKQLKICKLE